MRMIAEGFALENLTEGGGRRRTVHYEFPCSTGGTPQKLLERTGNGRVSEVESQVRGTGGRIDSTWPRAPCRFGMTGEQLSAGDQD